MSNKKDLELVKSTLTKAKELLDRIAAETQTPPCMSFSERDLTRQSLSESLSILDSLERPVLGFVPQELLDDYAQLRFKQRDPSSKPTEEDIRNIAKTYGYVVMPSKQLLKSIIEASRN